MPARRVSWEFPGVKEKFAVATGRSGWAFAVRE